MQNVETIDHTVLSLSPCRTLNGLLSLTFEHLENKMVLLKWQIGVAKNRPINLFLGKNFTVFYCIFSNKMGKCVQ